MATLNEEQARAYMHKLLAAMRQAGGSDLFIANDFPPSMKANGVMQPLTQQKLTGDLTQVLAHALMNERQPEFARPIWDYLSGALPESRIIRGRAQIEANEDLFQRLEIDGQRYSPDGCLACRSRC